MGLPAKTSLATGPGSILSRRADEWNWYRYRWRWLLDSYEGGHRYRDAVYGTDWRGIWIYNLVRHKRELPDPRESQQSSQAGYAYMGTGGSYGYGIGVDPTFRATQDDFEMRRARTPVPSFVEDAIDTHLGVIFSKEIHRTGIDGPEFARLRDWMEDVDGRGTCYQDWLREVFAPLLLALGQLDLYFDHPHRRPEDGDDGAILTQADVQALKLDRCLVQYILPECVTWWRIDPVTGQYLEVTVMESLTPETLTEGELVWHWTADSVLAVDYKQQVVVPVTPHGYGVVPIVRLFDKRKPRARNVGHSRYEKIADQMREYYNRDSELILSDTVQAHPLLQGPEDYVQADGTIPIGPSWLLPKKKTATGTGATYEGFDVIEFPKDGAESIRKNKQDIRDEVDRSAHMAKPAGASGGKVTAQSGVSKVMDATTGNKFLAGIARSLARSEKTIFEYALRCLFDRPDVSNLMANVDIVYPTDYDLQSAEDLGAFSADFMDLLQQAGNCPEAETTALCRYYRSAVSGLDGEAYGKIDDEIREYVEQKAEQKAELAEAEPLMLPPGGVSGQPADSIPPGTQPESPDDETTTEDDD